MTSAVGDTASAPRVLTVEVWSDVICPWCYIGKRRFERALAELAADEDLALGTGTRIDVRYRAYQLDPRAPSDKSTPAVEAYARKFGGPEAAEQILTHLTAVAAAEGLGFRMDLARRANTLTAHRLLWWAEQPESGLNQGQIKERLLSAYFIEGIDLGDIDALVGCAAQVGGEPDEIAGFLRSDRGLAEVHAMMAEATEMGITGVPAYVIDRRWTIPGAQDTEVFVQVLRRMLTTQR